MAVAFGYSHYWLANHSSPAPGRPPNTIQTRVDAHKLAVQSRRIRPQPASGIGLYSKIVNLLCFTAIVINAALFGITSSSMSYIFEELGYQVGDDLTSVWRYVLCSPGVLMIFATAAAAAAAELYYYGCCGCC